MLFFLQQYNKMTLILNSVTYKILFYLITEKLDGV